LVLDSKGKKVIASTVLYELLESETSNGWLLVVAESGETEPAERGKGDEEVFPPTKRFSSKDLPRIYERLFRTRGAWHADVG
jgi:hypothetical protein